MLPDLHDMPDGPGAGGRRGRPLARDAAGGVPQRAVRDARRRRTSAGGPRTRGASCCRARCTSPGPCAGPWAASRSASTGPSPRSWPPVPTRAGRTGGSAPSTWTPTASCTDWAGRTRSRSGTPTAAWPAACSASRWAGCSPPSPSSMCAPTPRRSPWWRWPSSWPPTVTPVGSSTSSGAPRTWPRWVRWRCRARSTCARCPAVLACPPVLTDQARRAPAVRADRRRAPSRIRWRSGLTGVLVGRVRLRAAVPGVGRRRRSGTSVGQRLGRSAVRGPAAGTTPGRRTRRPGRR